MAIDGSHETYTKCLTANDADSADKQCAILLSVFGHATYQLIQNILALVKPTECSFSDLVTIVEQHKNPKVYYYIKGLICPVVDQRAEKIKEERDERLDESMRNHDEELKMHFPLVWVLKLVWLCKTAI